MSVPPNNPLKGPFFILAAVVGVLVAIFGVLAGVWWIAVGGLLFAAACGATVRVIRQGRNPWWIRAPLDRWWSRRAG